MILTIILKLIYYAVYLVLWPLRLLPDASLPGAVSTAFATAGTYYKTADVFFPMDTAFTILGLILLFEGGVLTYKILMWTIKKIPGIN